MLAAQNIGEFHEKNIGDLAINIHYCKILVGKTLVNSDRFAKFANVFHRQRFALYDIFVSLMCTVIASS